MEFPSGCPACGAPGGRPKAPAPPPALEPAPPPEAAVPAGPVLEGLALVRAKMLCRVRRFRAEAEKLRAAGIASALEKNTGEIRLAELRLEELLRRREILEERAEPAKEGL